MELKMRTSLKASSYTYGTRFSQPIWQGLSEKIYIIYGQRDQSQNKGSKS